MHDPQNRQSIRRQHGAAKRRSGRPNAMVEPIQSTAAPPGSASSIDLTDTAATIGGGATMTRLDNPLPGSVREAAVWRGTVHLSDGTRIAFLTARDLPQYHEI